MLRETAFASWRQKPKRRGRKKEEKNTSPPPSPNLPSRATMALLSRCGRMCAQHAVHKVGLSLRHCSTHAHALARTRDTRARLVEEDGQCSRERDRLTHTNAPACARTHKHTQTHARTHDTHDGGEGWGERRISPSHCQCVGGRQRWRWSPVAHWWCPFGRDTPLTARCPLALAATSGLESIGERSLPPPPHSHLLSFIPWMACQPRSE